ncbi:protocadherin Fat 4-like [Pelobates cultripes]|uniref:Protocadherin Fat 4-like n=1 Tax=Pelobates cultripes TaxID=61616 RepID=A0AAD1VV14_PELCU|nr:protocadherin Fat 4-like [Pelobates cultripes]
MEKSTQLPRHCPNTISEIPYNEQPPFHSREKGLPIETNGRRPTEGTSDTRRDSGIDTTLTYKIIDQQPFSRSDIFGINSSTGQIVLLKPLNYERQKHFDIVVQGSVSNSSRMTSITTVRIKVLKIKDNYPKFSQALYNVSVPENLPVGSIICILNVTDMDKDGSFNGYFTINNTMFSVENNGVINLANGELDREHTPEIIMLVWAFDAESRELDSSALVTLNLLDVNDNNPEFQRQQIIFSIPEGDYTRDPPRVLGEVEVMDLDMGLNGEIMINSFSEEENFIVLQNGTVLVHGVLDRETKDKYVISLLASDLGNPPRKNFAEALILIQDVNDNKPTFTQKEYFAHIPRNMNEGDPVITISATDLDIGDNSQISYRFSQDYTGFTIDEQTGQIFISSSLSAITPESVRPLLVIASDLGTPALSSSVNVFVTVATNNTGLQFLNSHYNFSVPEDRPAGTEVGIVKTIIGNRGTSLTYFLKTYLEIFSITNKGQIITRVMLDRESQNRYNVIVEATDSQEPPSTAATMVTVIVIDVNDNRPIFSPMVHSSVTCIENENFLDIGLISATDVDVGDNSIVTYSLENDFNGIFYINSSTGDLMTKKALDREVATSYDVTVVAKDLGSPPRSSTKRIHITVEDVNDNPPIFNEKSFAVTVKENEPPQLLLNISAMDRDTGYNALILYSFTRATPLFYIGHYSGSISNLQPLDYETAMEHVLKVIAYNPTDSQLRGTATVTDGNSEGLFVISNSTGHIFLIKDLPKHRTTVPYILTVKVMDSGVPPLSAFVKVYITIVPSNISFPVFSTDIYRPDPVSDKASPSTFLVQVYALYPTFLLYNITAGNDKDYFNMEPVTGVITTKMALQKEDFPRDITIMAVDPKNVSIFSQAQVHVSVKDDNSFTPVFPNPLVELTIKEKVGTSRRSSEGLSLITNDAANGQGCLEKGQSHLKRWWYSLI